MNSNGESFDNSLDSALNMSQDEIEKLLNGQFETEENIPDFETSDLDSLLSELEAMDDGDIQEISDLLDKADNNEPVDQNIMDLLNLPDDPEENPAYEAIDLFSADEKSVPKESFIKKILSKFKRKSGGKNINEEEPLNEDSEKTEAKEEKKRKEKKEKKVKEKKVKEKKVKKKNGKADEEDEAGSKPEWDNIETLDLPEDALNGSDAIIMELEKEEIAQKEEKIKEKPKKDEKSKKKKDKSKKKDSEKDSESENDTKKQDKKKPKEKKVKEKKEKPVVLYDYDETPMTKKKVGLVFFFCIMLMLALIVVIVNFAGYRNKHLAEHAYEQGDYLQCYQMLYGQHLNEGQEVLYHKSKINLKMELLWKRYDDYMDSGQSIQGLDRLVQFVYEYPKTNMYATEWDCEALVEQTYQDVLRVLYDEYKLSEQDVIELANISDDVEYTRTLMLLIEKKENGMLKYPDMLPEEEERINNIQ